MKKSSLAAGLMLVLLPVVLGYQFFHWRAERREANEMAYICADNSDYLIDPLDMDLKGAHVEPALVPETGKAALYKGQTVEKIMIPSLATQESRYKCAMYKSADSGHWAVIPRKDLRAMSIE